MKELTIIRHAKTEQADINQSDFERRLLPKGLEQCKAQGAFLKRNCPEPELILISSAYRTIQTYEELINITLWDKHENAKLKSLYMASAESLINKIAEQSTNIKKLMIIGHNFGVANLVSFLSGKMLMKYKTGSIAHFHINTDDWVNITPNNSKLIYLESPLA